MISKGDDEEKRKKLSRDHDDIDDIIDRIERVNRIRDLFSTDEGGWKLEEPAESDPEILDVGETITITLDIPHIGKEDIELSMGDWSVSISAARLGFRKKVFLPSEVVREGSRATYKNGVLDIVLRKAPERCL
jgi:HSP20 family molecular chaperone IbpA